MNAYKDAPSSPYLPLSVVQALISGWLLDIDTTGRVCWIEGPTQETHHPIAWYVWRGQLLEKLWPAQAMATLQHAFAEAEKGNTPSKSYSVALPMGTQLQFFSLTVVHLSHKTRAKKAHFLVWLRPDDLHHELVQMAFLDSLTGLPNRRLLHDRITQAMHAVCRTKEWGAILFLDLDGFKRINDQWGHAAGDDILRQVAQRLTSTTRKTDTVARLGGDEFIVLLRHLGASEQVAMHGVQQVMNGLLKQVAGQAFKWQSAEVCLSVSIGAALFDDQNASSFTADELIHHADQAMYQAKSAGKNTSRLFFVPSFHSKKFIQNQTDGPQCDGRVGQIEGGEMTSVKQPI